MAKKSGEIIALFGGAFNPIHNGHVVTARAAVERLGLDRLLLVPSARPPHKPAPDLASGEDRLEMCRLAAEGDERLEPSGMEIRRSGVSYTIDTVSEVRREHPGATVILLIGADMLRMFHQWRRAEEIVRAVRLVTLPRPGVEVGRLEELRTMVGEDRVERILGDVLDTPLVDVSSTEIRERVRRGEGIEGMVPAAVARYIAERGLYR